jgi:nucleotide-binding universal stress UspA family protein
MNAQEQALGSTRSVVAAMDYSNLAELALEAAIADAEQTGATLHVLHVTPSVDSVPVAAFPGTGAGIVTGRHGERMAEAASALVRHVEARLQGRQLTGDVICHLRVGDAAKEVPQFATEVNADTIYVATHGRTGIKRLFLGSVAESTLRKAPCPTVVMRPKTLSSGVKIEPPCPQCVETRRATDGREMWCDQHASGMGRRHVYHFSSRNVRAHPNAPLVLNMDRPGF